MKVYSIYKKIGQTPLEALEVFRKKTKLPSFAKLTYAGRLDPMASGVLIILQGATQEQRGKYMSLSKVYKAQVLFGFSTDSYDLLGLPTFGVIPSLPVRQVGASEARPTESFGRGSLNLSNIKQAIKNYKGSVSLSIPPYSSVMYKGKPLFEWARSGKIKEKDLPKREMEIKDIEILGNKKLTSVDILRNIENKIKKVNGDFRQKEILKAWKKLLCHPRTLSASEGYLGSSSKFLDSGSGAGMTHKYQLLTLEISCASGTYIRSIANDLGNKLGTQSVLFNLERLSVGKFTAVNGIKI